jgi:hypothetical protein
VGSYAIDTSGLYSSQQGYDISYVNGTATITAATVATVVTTDNAPLLQAQQSEQATQTRTAPVVTSALDSQALEVQSCGVHLPDGMACQ